MLWPGRRSARFSKGICCRTYRTSGFPLARMVRTVLSGLDETCGLPSRFGFGLHLILKVRPETNGVSNGPRKPKSPAIPIAARMTSTARARKGPMKGIAKRMGVKAAPIAAKMATAAVLRSRAGMPTMTTSTSQVAPLKCAFKVKSAVKVMVSE